jgi:hypothetical protein
MIHVKNDGTRVLFGLKLSGELYPRPLVDTYHYLKRKYPKCTWGELSLRKRVCLAYVSWMMFPEKDNRSELIELVKEWRKKEPNRIGGKRSVLEKLARKFFAEEAKKKRTDETRKSFVESGKKAFENKTGIHSPEIRALVKTPEMIRKSNEKRLKVQALHWILYAPDGQIFEIHNLNAFGREHNLNASHLARTAKFPGTTHKGWRARKRNVDLEGVTPGFEM